MMTMMMGLTAVLLGLLFMVFWWDAFSVFLKAGIPVVLILGGALATYLGMEEKKELDSMAKAESAGANEGEVEKFKAEAESLKSEVDSLKEEAADDDKG